MRGAYLLASALVCASGVAEAQRLAVDPDSEELTDYDAESEGHSQFWEQALSPGAGTYADLIDKAIDTMSLSLDDARTILEDAIARQPDQAEAHFWLGFAGFKANKWKMCATGFSKAVSIDPDFRPKKLPPRETWNSWSTDYTLGFCLAQSGQLDRAAERLARITSRYELCGRSRRNRGRGCYDWTVGWRLGEVLMALGRLEEAIAVLDNTRGGGHNNVELRYTLAVALERDEQEYKATELLKAAYRNDYNAQSLRRASRLYIPASDAYYYRALAAETAGDWGKALVLFRAYIEKVPKSPWVGRARDHIAHVVKQTSQVEIRGRATFDTKAMNAAMAAAMPDLEKCLDPLPDQVVSLTIRRRITTASRGRRPAVDERSVHINWLNPLGTTLSPAKSQTASACIRAKVDGLKLPPLMGYPGEASSYAIELFSRSR